MTRNGNWSGSSPREYHLITREDRLERIGEDIVAHYMGRGVLAKAMVISIDKATAVRTFDKVQKHWKVAIAKLRKEMLAADPMDKPELEERLRVLRGDGHGGGCLASRKTKSRSSRRRAWTSPRTASGW